MGRDDLAAAAAEAVARPARGSPATRSERRAAAGAPPPRVLPGGAGLGALDPARERLGDGDGAGLTPKRRARRRTIRSSTAPASVRFRKTKATTTRSFRIRSAARTRSDPRRVLGAPDFAAAGSAGGGGHRASHSATHHSETFSSHFDGMAHVERFVGPLLFGRDRRLREARALLASAAPASIALGASDAGAGAGAGGDPGGGRAAGAPVEPRAAHGGAALGRGAFTLGTRARAAHGAAARAALTLAGRLPARAARWWRWTWPPAAPPARRSRSGPSSTTAWRAGWRSPARATAG